MDQAVDFNYAYKMIMNNLSLRFFLKNTDLIYTECNDLFAHDAGYCNKEDIIGRDDSMMLWRNIAEIFRAEDIQIIKNKRPLLNREQAEKKEDGSRMWIRLSKMPLLDSKGNAAGIFGYYEDITEKKKKESELAGVLKELERSNKELELFAYIASHDLNEPIRTIINYLGLVEKKNASSDQIDMQHIRRAINASVRMRHMTEDLLVYSRVNTRSINKSLCSAEKILHDACDNLKFFIDKKEALITHDSLPVICADEIQIMSVFQNLLNNAVKFCVKEKPSIHVSFTETNDEWIFGVKDNGIGIKEKDHDKVFNMFEHLNSKHDYPGTGIGLTIVKKIIDKHNGRLWINSSLNEGSVFYFSIKKEV